MQIIIILIAAKTKHRDTNMELTQFLNRGLVLFQVDVSARPVA